MIRPKVYDEDDLEWIHFGIAVPKQIIKEIKLTAPNRSPPNKTEIDIEMFDVEIIDFDVKMQQFTLRMGLKIIWPEKRLKLVKSSRSLVNGWMAVSGIWVPQLDIRSVVVSESRKLERLDVAMDSQSEVSKWNWYDKYINYLVQSFTAKMKFSLTTTVKCSMNFDMFPFDSHICKLEVSLLSNFFKFCSYYINETKV